MGTMRTAIPFLLALSLGVAWADQITLSNGDRITGAIIKKDGDELMIKSRLLGLITAPWDEIVELRSDAPLTVVLPDRTVQATLETVDGKVQFKEWRETVFPGVILALRNAEEQAAYERLLNPGWSQLWAGSGTIGLAGTAGNARTTTFTASILADRITNNDKTTVYFNAVKSSARVDHVVADTAQAVRGGWAYSHNISPRWFLNVFNDYEYDRFQDLDLRIVLGGGLGYIAWQTERSRLDLLAGAAYDRSKFSPPAPAPAFTRNSAEVYWGDDYSYKVTGVTDLIQRFRMFNNVTDPGEYRINFDITALTKLSKWLTWTVGISDRYLSNPVPGNKTNDVLYTTGVGISFAR